MSLLQFNAHILQGPLNSGVVAEADLFTPVATWRCLASHHITGTAAGSTLLVSMVTIPAALPPHMMGLTNHTR
jgi:hypothetical protein